MITFIQGDIFDSPARMLVNPVNTEGVMGRGLAKQFKERFPEALSRVYALACRCGDLQPGGIWIWTTTGGIQYVCCAATKKYWSRPSRPEWVESCIGHIRKMAEGMGIPSVAVPALGCGLGGLSWAVVKEMMIKEFTDSEVEFFVYEPIDEDLAGEGIGRKI